MCGKSKKIIQQSLQKLIVKMLTQFRKVLLDFELYRTNIHAYLTQIEKGTPGTLSTLVCEVQKILAVPNEIIISKVLSMRVCNLLLQFARDIMILGRNDVINELVCIVPHMIKICLHRKEENHPERGETLFNSHPNYMAADEEGKRKIQLYASTFFILTMESIIHWALWIPTDQSGNQSIYSKAYMKLLDQGVKFEPSFHYYKQSDTERFKNVFKMQFFSQSSFLDADSRASSCPTSKIQNKSQKTEKSDQSFRNEPFEKQFFDIDLNSMKQLKKVVNDLGFERKPSHDKLEHINKTIQNLLQMKYSNQFKRYSVEQKEQKKWLQKYIISYGLFKNSKISFEQFLKRMTSQIVRLPIEEEIAPEGDIPTLRMKGENTPGFAKNKKSNKRQSESTTDNKDLKQFYQGLIKKQEQSYKRQIDSFRLQRDNYHRDLAKIKKKFQQDQQLMVQQYQSRIKLLKKGFSESNIDKTDYLVKQNQKLREQIFELQRGRRQQKQSLIQLGQSEQEKKELLREIENLKSQNNRLKVKLLSPEEKEYYVTQIEQLQKRLDESNHSRLKSSISDCQKTIEQELIKKNKQIKNLSDELNLYKSELSNERTKYNKKVKNFENKMSQIQSQCSKYRQKASKLQKTLDLRDIEAIQLSQQVRLYQQFDRQVGLGYEMEGKSLKPSVSQEKIEMTKNEPKQPGVSLKYKKYEGLRNMYRDSRELFLRFCRCSLKKKDLLMKENELEIGLITEKITEQQMKFIIHLTNVSASQVDNIKIGLEHPSFIQAQISTEFIFCIQKQEQQKVIIHCKNMRKVIERENYMPIQLLLQFDKNNKNHESMINLPFLPFKIYEYSEPTAPSTFFSSSKRKQLILVYSRKLIPEPEIIKHYISALTPIQNEQNSYECDIVHKSSQSKWRLYIKFDSGNKLRVEMLPTLLNNSQFFKQEAFQNLPLKDDLVCMFLLQLVDEIQKIQIQIQLIKKYMSSPKKNIDIEKQTTMFGQLSQIEKNTTFVNKQLVEQLQLIKKLKSDFTGMEKEGVKTAKETKGKINEQIKQFEDRIRNYLTTQKAQYMRFSTQINNMIQNSKEINSQLMLLGTKFNEFQKNVGI